MILGIPRSLLYFTYAPLWEAFFSDLGVETLLSPPTCKAILESGVRVCVNEACLPLKVFFGHVDYLRTRADALFVPRFISVHSREYACPKLGGLPDMVRWGFESLPPVLDTRIDLYRDRHGLQKAARSLGGALGYGEKQSKAALDSALAQYHAWRKNAPRVFPDPARPRALPDAHPRILLLGHAYNVYDPFVNMNLVDKILSRGGTVVTADMIDERLLRRGAEALERAMFWSFGAELTGGVYAALDDPAVDGIVFVTSFGCGPDAFIENMAMRRAKAANMPFLTLTIDEHAGEAGLDTRLEAFLDTLAYRALRAAPEATRKAAPC